MQHDITLLGFNHRSADVSIRERFAVKDPASLESRLLAHPAVSEALTLSTCNRVELTVVCEPGFDAKDHVLSAWAAETGSPRELLEPATYRHEGLAAVSHVFRVACGLDSMVLGEPQILGQLKTAYRGALERGAARVVVNRLAHKAFSVAKKVRTETGIGTAAVSIAYAAVELAKRIFGDLTGLRAMLIGAGEMAELAATHLKAAGASSLTVVNRTFARAQDLANAFGGKAILFEELGEAMAAADIIISSTGSQEPIIRAKGVKEVMKRRKQSPMFFIDIAVPRDIDPDVGNLDNVFLYDIDDLQEVVAGNVERRRLEAKRAELIVASEVESFGGWLSSMDLTPTIKDLLALAEDIARREAKKTARGLNREQGLDEAAVERLALSVAHKVLHEPVIFLKRRAREEGGGERFLDLVRRMFNLDEEFVPDDAHADRLADDAQTGAEQSCFDPQTFNDPDES